MPVFVLVLFFIATSISTVTAQRKPGVHISLFPAALPDSSPDRLFGTDSVYTTLDDTARIGIAYRAMVGQFAPIYMKEGLNKAFQQYLYSLYPMLSPRHEPIRMVVEEFSYSEDPAQGLSFEANLIFLRKDSTNQFAPFYHAELSHESRGSSLARGALIQKHFLRAFDAMNRYLKDPSGQPAYLSDYESQMAKAAVEMKLDTAKYMDTAQTVENDIRYCQNRRAGIYLTVEELLKNRPSLTGDINFQQKNDFATLLKANGRRAKYRFFGFCDGKDLYINSSRYGDGFAGYARILNVGRYLLWRDDYLTKSEITTRAAAMQFGLVGGLVGAAAANRRDCIAIDSETGKLFHITPERATKIITDVPALLSDYEANGRSRKADKLYELMVRYNESQTKP